MKRARGAARGVVRLTALGLALVGPLAVAAPGDTTRVSVSSAGFQANRESGAPELSADGRYAAFASEASNLVVGDTNGAFDVFIRDRQTGATTLVSIAVGGGAANGGSYTSSISADGRHVAFDSHASNLIVGDTNGTSDVFVRDRQTGATTLVSIAVGGGAANGSSYEPSISADGRYVAFGSEASNLVAGDTNGTSDVFVHDRQTGSTTLVSDVPGGGASNAATDDGPSISADGRYVAFRSRASNLVPGDTNGMHDIFVRDRQTGGTRIASAATGGAVGNEQSVDESISGDGRYVAFYSEASNLVAGDTNGTSDVFVHDRQTGITSLVSVSSSGGSGNSASESNAISADGRYVAFDSNASNLVVGDTNGERDVFVRDLQTGITSLVSVSTSGGLSNGDSGVLSITADGRYVAFVSSASNLVPGDTNGYDDVFVHELGTAPPPLGPLDPQPRPAPGVPVPVPPGPSEPPNPTKRGLIVAVHGWNSDPTVWANELVQSVRGQIDQALVAGTGDPTIRWSLISWDWRVVADLDKGGPWTAHANAADQGRQLGKSIAKASYDYVHFIAHSAGSELVEVAASQVRKNASKQPFIHTTFLDAYHPSPEDAQYGTVSSWAEQFVDKRDSLSSVVGWGALENTNLVLPQSFNFDVTLLEDRSGIWNVVQAHAWPHVWYRRTALAPILWRYGWGASIEHDLGRVPLHAQFARGKECQLVAVNTNCSAVSSVIRELVFFPVSGLYDPWRSAPNVTVTPSPTGVVDLGTVGQIQLTVGSPAWVQLTSNVGVEIDSMRFGYQFSGGTDGLLSVFLDNQLVFRADQANADEGVNLSGIVPLGKVPMGPHTITFRLDHFGVSQPKVTISSTSYGSSRFVDRTNTPPVANAGPPQEASAGSRVRLNGSASRDADGGPLPLVFRWRQVSGPTVRLEEPASSSPSFIANQTGAHEFELTVHDGHEWSAPSTVRITITQAAFIANPAEELAAFDPKGLLRWGSIAGADAYEVWAYRDAGLTQLAEFSKALTSREYQFTQLVGGQTYYVKIYYRVGGVWQQMPTFTLTTTANVAKARLLNSQEELEGFGPSGTLRWTAVAGADVYELWIYRDAARVAFAEASGPVRITQYRITSLTPGKTYYVQVYARVNGQYTAGDALRLTVTAQQNRARILNPQEELDAFASNGILRWSPVTGATSYELWIFTDPNSANFYEASGSLGERNYATRTLQPGKVYYAQAYSLVNGQWQVGSPVKITTAGQVTKARLTTPQAELESFSTTGTLRWTEVPGATAYELWIFGNAGLGTIIESGANAGRSYQVRRLCSAATYYVQVFSQVNGQWTTGWANRLDVAQGAAAADCVPPAPVITLTADPVEVLSGESVTLNWTSKFATSCTASGAWTGEKPLSGQATVGPISKNSLFSLACTGQSGAYRAETLVTVTTSKLGKLVITRGVEKTQNAEKASSGLSGGGAADGWLLLGLGALGCAARTRRRPTAD